MSRPPLDEILAGLRVTAIRQLQTTAQGRAVAAACDAETLCQLVDCIVRNQATYVDAWLEDAAPTEVAA